MDKRHGGMSSSYSAEDIHTSHLVFGYLLFAASLAFVLTLSLAKSQRLARFAGLDRVPGIRPPPKLVQAALWLLFLTPFVLMNPVPALSGYAKRLGRITYALFPLTLFLSLRPTPVLNTSYLDMVFLHKWVSRTIALTGVAHGIAYLIHFIQHKTLYKILKLNNMLGVTVLTCILIMTVTSLRFIRTRAYGVFYALHYPLAWISVVLIIFHARPGVGFLAFWAILILVAQVFVRVLTLQRVVPKSVETISSTLSVVTLPRSVLPERFEPGSHVRLSRHRPLYSPRAWLESTHPYTVASLPEDEDVKLLVRIRRFEITAGITYNLLTGFAFAKGHAMYERAQRVLLFAGGSGLSLAAPLSRELTSKGTKVKVVWFTNSAEEAGALDMLSVTADVFVTKSSHDDSEAQAEGIELEGLLHDSEAEDETDTKASESMPRSKQPGVSYGKPSLASLAEEFAPDWAVACGPRELVAEAERWARQAGVELTTEMYAL